MPGQGWREQSKSVLGWVSRRCRLTVTLALLALLMFDAPPPGELETRIGYLLAGDRFDFVGWEAGALLGKWFYGLFAPQRYMGERARHDFVLDYLRLVREIARLEHEVERLYADPYVEDPAAATAELRAQLAALRAEEEARQLIAEAILEEQTAYVLVREGFGVLDQELPPVSAHFTPLPLMLIVSPRERIENVFSLPLCHGMDVAQQEVIEERIDADLDVSSLVTGIGGLAAYPSMILESDSLPWVAEAIAHEWAHHYLTATPLGWNYEASGEARTINETVASIVGKEIGRAVIARYYPELLPPEPAPAPQEAERNHVQPAESLEFDFRLEMRRTRVRVDELLAEGRIEEAEAYMEERRQEFVAHGWMIRKLNQAYFAFHGSYADEPGAAGEDPIGPAVRELRARSPDLYAFVARVSNVTSLAELHSLLANP